MFCLKIFICLFLFVSQIESNSLISQKYWYLTCSSSECTTAINSCLNCLGERMCKACITNANPECSTCANDIFNKEDLETIEGENYFICESSDPIQAKICHFYCRGQYSQFGQCVIQQNLPVCQCISATTSTTTNAPPM